MKEKSLVKYKSADNYVGQPNKNAKKVFMSVEYKPPASVGTFKSDPGRYKYIDIKRTDSKM